MIIKLDVVTDTKRRIRDLNGIFLAQVLLRILRHIHIKLPRVGNFEFLRDFE